VVNLGLRERGPLAPLRRVAALRRALRPRAATAPDLVISLGHRTNVQVLVALFAGGIPVIVAEHSNPFRSPSSWRWRLLRRLAYRLAARVVVLNARCAAYFGFLPPGRVAVIPNPVPPPPEAPEASRSPVILGLGRLD